MRKTRVIQNRRQVQEISLYFARVRYQSVLICSAVFFVKNESHVSGGGTLSPRPEGSIQHWQENHQKQEEAGKGYESPQGTAAVTAAES